MLDLSLVSNYYTFYFKDSASNVRTDFASLVSFFVDAHAFLLEPACTASLTPIYIPSILRLSLPSTKFPLEAGSSPRRFDSTIPIVVIVVCGGNTLSMDDFERYEKEFTGEDRGYIKIFNGEISREEIVFKA